MRANIRRFGRFALDMEDLGSLAKMGYTLVGLSKPSGQEREYRVYSAILHWAIYLGYS